MKKYKEFIVGVSESIISITRDGHTIAGSNETGLVIVDTGKQEVYQAFDTKGYKKKRVVYKGL